MEISDSHRCRVFFEVEFCGRQYSSDRQHINPWIITYQAMLYLYQFINQLQLLIYYGKNASLPIEVKQKLQSCTDDKNRSLLGMSGNQNGFNSQSWKEVSGSYNWESVQNPELTTDIINS